ncbi:glycosyl transferase [Azorhizobium oxalatiphilum]|uniref:Glycosyl transferase n=1 Tax=Azorhizobium oxalatiphilum TaxID=980631 RepID=A0A917F5M1_9HYPH|nr:glycosyltransferase family 1 protein [Azorhizobium oxalatiphilum]GGF54295.1 glycosyl transferase [Azorhizobium oxalatiphilum]
MTRHWTINGRFLTQPVTGVQRYAREIVLALDELLAEGDPLACGLGMELVVPTPEAAGELALKAMEVRVAGGARGHVWEQTVLARQVRGGVLSLSNSGPLMARRHILCIHDANTRIVPQSYSAAFRLLHRTLIPALGRTAVKVATVSDYSADQLVGHGVTARAKLMVAYNGHEHTRRWTPVHTPATQAVAGPDTIVIIGSQAPHKNVGLVLGLAGRLAQEGLRIALVGHADPNVFRSDGAGAAPNILRLGRLGDNALAALLEGSLCLAFPSITEGFGLPPLEAMARGCPAVVSDSGALPELCGRAVLYAAPDDPDLWFRQFLRLRNDPHLRAELVRRGRERALRFSWRRSAHAYLEAMAAADGVVAPNDDTPAYGRHTSFGAVRVVP